MNKRYKNTFRSKILEYIQEIDKDVIMRAWLNKLGEARQISRALKALVDDGVLIKISKGIYVKTKITKYSDKPIMKISFTEAGIEALKLLNIKWKLGKAIEDYNAGRSQQVPINFIIKLESRFRGEIGDGNRKIIFEGRVNAR